MPSLKGFEKTLATEVPGVSFQLFTVSFLFFSFFVVFVSCLFIPVRLERTGSMPHLEDEFGDIIGKARTGLRLSLEQLAHSTGISIPTLSAMESYTRKPSREEAEAIAKELNLHPSNLLAIAEERWHPAPWNHNHDPDAEVLRWEMPVGAYSAYCYLLRCQHTGESAVIDTGGQGKRVIAQLRQHRVRPRYILVTHEHGDHTGGIDLVQAETGATILDGQDASVPKAEQIVDGQSYALGRLKITAYSTPGHTAGCISYVAGLTAFVGDTLFAGSAGRANYSYTALLDSIRNKLLTLDENVHLFPGHGPVTTVGQEKEHNPFITA